MKIILYGWSGNMDAIADKLRRLGHFVLPRKASLFRPRDVEKCDQVLLEPHSPKEDEIFAAYETLKDPVDVEVFTPLHSGGVITGPSVPNPAKEPAPSVVGTPDAETLTDAPKAASIERHGNGHSQGPEDASGDQTSGDQTGSENADGEGANGDNQNAPPPTPLSEEVISAAVDALFGRARSKGLKKEDLRSAIQEKGLEVVAKDLGVEKLEDLNELMAGKA